MDEILDQKMDEESDLVGDQQYIGLKLISEDGKELNEAPIILPIATTVRQLQVFSGYIRFLLNNAAYRSREVLLGNHLAIEV